MNLTNKYDLPQSLVNAVGRFSYSRGKSDISVTQLIDSPRIVKLKELHNDKIVSDISEEIWKLVGSALHLIAESNTNGEEKAVSSMTENGIFPIFIWLILINDFMVRQELSFIIGASSGIGS